MRIAFLTEGATEAAIAPGASGSEAWPRVGSLVLLVERILGVRGKIEPWVPRVGRGAGAGRVLAKGPALLRGASADGVSGAVMLVDADSHGHDRLGVLRGHADKLRTESTALWVPTAFGVAVEKFEAWLLADELSLCRVLGLPNPDEPLKNPEEFKGKRGDADDAKAKLKEYLARDKRGPRAFLDQIRAIVAEMDLNVAARRCRSFEQFRQEVREQLGPLFSLPASYAGE